MYKLINTETKSEFICEKIEIDGFEYYVGVEIPINGEWAIYDNKELVKTSTISNPLMHKKVISTNNPTLDIPQVADEVNCLYPKLDVCSSEDTMNIYLREGYNKAKEQYQYSKQDMIEFVRFSMAKELTSDRIKNLPECLELFEKSRTKTIYFK